MAIVSIHLISTINTVIIVAYHEVAEVCFSPQIPLLELEEAGLFFGKPDYQALAAFSKNP